MTSDARDRVDPATARRLKKLIAGSVDVSHHEQDDGGRCYHVQAISRRDRRAIMSKGPTAQAAHDDLILALRRTKHRAAEEQARARVVDAEVEETMSRLGIPSDPIPPRCSPTSPCPAFDERHFAMYDACYVDDSIRYKEPAR